MAIPYASHFQLHAKIVSKPLGVDNYILIIIINNNIPHLYSALFISVQRRFTIHIYVLQKKGKNILRQIKIAFKKTAIMCAIISIIHVMCLKSYT